MLRKETREEIRYYYRSDFNPSSTAHLLSYMEAKGLQGGRNHKSKTGAPTTDQLTLERLSKKDKLFELVLRWRKIGKMDGTYATGLLAHADAQSRIHTRWTHVPSTWRLSSTEPNLQNIPSPDEDMLLSIAIAEIRRAFVAQPGCLLVSGDFSAIEAVLTGYFANDPEYMRLARLGIHSYLVAHKVGDPPDLGWSDKDLGEHLTTIKRKYHDAAVYKALKRTVHLSNYGGTPYQMVRVDPILFPTVGIATDLQNFYFLQCPKLKDWQSTIRGRAIKQGYLGGADHPYHFRHWFWDVTGWDPQRGVVPGSDWNRCVAFYPQSTAAGIIFDAVLALMDPQSPWFVGDYFYGKTPLRALIHDEILAEVPEEKVDNYIERLRMAMKEPMPELAIGSEIKVGKNWVDMKAV